LNGGGALIRKRWNFRERCDRAPSGRTRGKGRKGWLERKDQPRKTKRRERVAKRVPIGMPREGYSGNGGRLHRPFSVRPFAYANSSPTLRAGKDPAHARALREIALIVVRESRGNSGGMRFPV